MCSHAPGTNATERCEVALAKWREHVIGCAGPTARRNSLVWSVQRLIAGGRAIPAYIPGHHGGSWVAALERVAASVQLTGGEMWVDTRVGDCGAANEADLVDSCITMLVKRSSAAATQFFICEPAVAEAIELALPAAAETPALAALRALRSALGPSSSGKVGCGAVMCTCRLLAPLCAMTYTFVPGMAYAFDDACELRRRRAH